MLKATIRRFVNRVLHLLARNLPGGSGLRPALHRLRGVQIGRDVFIGDEVYLENEYPEAVEIGDNVQIGVRAILIAHTRGPGRIVIERDAYVGPNAVLTSTRGRTLRIGEGAVIGASAVISSDVAARTLVMPERPRVVATVRVPLAKAERFEDFVRGLEPVRRSGKRRTDS